MNVEIGAEAAQFPEKEYINGIFVAVDKRQTVPHTRQNNFVLPLHIICQPPLMEETTVYQTVPHADDNRIEPCRVQQQRGPRDHQYQ